ncbi:MAG: hypothetical protein U1F18_05590 [Steroidobacteraceae bacterium]
MLESVAVAPINETAFQVLSYLHSVRPLRHCGTDDAAELGRRVADRIAWEYQLQGDAADLTSEEACNLLHWLHWCEPAEGARVMGEPIDPETALVGLHILIGTAERSLRAVLGLDTAQGDETDAA